MKRVITKFWGIGLVIVLLASLFVAAAPASGADLSVSRQGTPSALTNQIGALAAANFDSSFLKVAPNGDLFCVNTEAGTATVNRIYKSTTGGLFWAPSAPVTGIGAYALVDLAVSPSYATDSTVMVLGSTAALAQVFISTNGGVTFAVLGGAIVGRGTSLAIAPTYNGGGEVMVGFWDATATGADADATLGGVAIWGRGGVLTWDVATSALAGDVSKVAYSPTFMIDQTRLAVSSTLAAGTVLNTLVAANAAWDTMGGPRIINALILGPFEAAAGNNITNADVAMPSDFNASLPTSRTCYVSTVSAAGAGVQLDTIQRVTVGANLPANANLLPFGAGLDAPFLTIAYSGTLVAGTLYVGQTGAAGVWQTANPTVAAGLVTWMPNLAGPSGTTNTYVALANDIATSGRVYASTDGVQSAVSISDSGGVFFYQAGMIDTTIANINDFKVASATDYYMVTNDAAATIDSLWKSADAGATWTRVYNAIFLGNSGIVRPSPAYATDGTVYFGDNSAAAGGIQVTNNAGMSFTARTAPIAFADIAVKDQYTAYIGGSAAALVDSTANGGWTWQVASTPVIFGGICNDLKINIATGHLLYGDVAGLVFVSSTSNVSWVIQGGGVGGAALVEFDANYDTTNIIYGANSAAAVGVDGLPGTGDDVGICSIQRFNTTTPTVAWAAIGGVGAVVADIMAAPDGTLYASDATAANAAGTAGGLVRYLDPTAFIPATTERLTVGVFGDNMIAGDLFTVLTMAEGSNIAFAVNNIAAPLGPNIRTWGDTLSAVSPVVASPADGAIVNPVTLMVTVEAVTGALNYQVQWNTMPSYLGVGAVVAIGWPNLTTPAGAFNVVAMPAGATIYYRTRAATPVNSQWSATRTFETQLAAAVTTAPGIVGAVEGGTNVGGWDASINPTFQWGAIGNATAYEFRLATDAAMTNLLVDATGADALGVVTAYKPAVTLDYGTTYYWQVRAIAATTDTDWTIVVAFTTLAAPVAPPEPVVITTTPAPEIVIEIPPAPPATVIEIPPAPADEVISPAYIYVIIIIGAVLVIAVIVLIVRTRRQV